MSKTGGMRTFATALLSFALLLGCGGDTTDEPKGNLELHLHLEPSPARVGQARLHIHIVDADGANVDGATLEVEPWMPSHGHGSPETPKVVGHGDGMYEAFPITFNMPGPWEIGVKAKTDEDRGSATLEVDVQG